VEQAREELHNLRPNLAGNTPAHWPHNPMGSLKDSREASPQGHQVDNLRDSLLERLMDSQVDNWEDSLPFTQPDPQGVPDTLPTQWEMETVKTDDL